MKTRKVPLRKCVITGERVEKRELFRVVRTPEGIVSVDVTGKMNGRGVYLIKDISVIKKAMKTKKLDRHLETTVPDEVYQTLLGMFDES